MAHGTDSGEEHRIVITERVALIVLELIELLAETGGHILADELTHALAMANEKERPNHSHSHSHSHSQGGT